MPSNIRGALDLDIGNRSYAFANEATGNLLRDRATSTAARDYQRAETETPGSGRNAATSALRGRGYLTEAQEFDQGELANESTRLNNENQVTTNQDGRVSLAHRQASGAANMLRALRRIQTPEQRRVMGERFRGQFETMGVSREEIDGFDYSDQSLDQLIAQLEGAQDIESVEEVNGMMVATRRDGSQHILGEAPMTDNVREAQELELETSRAGLENTRAQTAYYNRRGYGDGSGSGSRADRRMTPEEIRDAGLNPNEPWRIGRTGRPYIPTGAARPRVSGEIASRVQSFLPTMQNAAVRMQRLYEEAGSRNPLGGARGVLSNVVRDAPAWMGGGTANAARMAGPLYDQFNALVAGVEGPVTNIIAGASQTEGEARRVARLIVVQPEDSAETVASKMRNMRMLTNTFATMTGRERPFPEEGELEINGLQTEEPPAGYGSGDDDDEDFSGADTDSLIEELNRGER